MRHVFLLITWYILSANAVCCAQDSSLVTYLTNRLAEQQVKQDAFFLKNIFPSYISNHRKFDDRKKDNNIFFNALISYNLRTFQQLLPLKERLLCDSIRSRSEPVFMYFKNKKGRTTYNFWRTDSAYTFPYTSWIHLVKKNTALPDDMDDTVLSLLALDAPDSVAKQVHALMQRYTNSSGNKVKSSLKDYQHINAYSTWFGKNFPTVFDVCVLTNILSFVQTYNLEWTNADSASLELIIKAIQNKDHLEKAIYISPYYGKPSIILYHLARLMSIKKIPRLEALKTSLVMDAVSEFGKTGNLLEKVILCTAIMKWEQIPPAITMPSLQQVKPVIERNNLPFFIGNIPSYFPLTVKKVIGNKWGLFYHYSPAYNNVLLLEYLLLKNLLVH
jgi:hypothetical protein